MPWELTAGAMGFSWEAIMILKGGAKSNSCLKQE
jgi:hypothetical protein